MHFSISPIILANAAAFLLVWLFHEPVLRAIYGFRAERLRQRIEVKLGGHLVCIVGSIDDDRAAKWTAQIRAAPAGAPLDVLILSNGGASHARSRVGRALSMHQGLTVAHVADFAWSAGTGIAATCDRIHMAPDAVLGPFDPSRREQSSTFCAVECLSAETGMAQPLIRSNQALDETEDDLRRARGLRRAFHWRPGDPVLAAHPVPDPDDKLVAQLVRGGWGNHWRPIFIEDAQALGLDARLEGRVMAELFFELGRLSMLALREDQR